MLYTLTTAQVLYALGFFFCTSITLVAMLGFLKSLATTPTIDTTQPLSPACVGEYTTEEDFIILPLVEIREVRRVLHRLKKKEESLKRVLQWLDEPAPSKPIVNIEYLTQAPTMGLKRTPKPNTMRYRINKRKAHTRATQWLQQHKGIKTKDTQSVWAQLRQGRKILYC